MSGAGAREAMSSFRCIASKAETIASAVAYAIALHREVDLNQIIVRPGARTGA